MSHCLECRASAPHNYDGLTESCKRHHISAASSCPCCNSYDFRDDFLLSSFAPPRADCAECLRVSSVYGFRFGLGYPQECLPGWQSDVAGDVAKQALDKRHRAGGCPHCADGCNVVIGVDRQSSPLCAGKTHSCLTHVTPVNKSFTKPREKKVMAANHGTCLSFRHCDILSSPDCSKELLTSFNEKTPVKCADEDFGAIMEEKIKESEFLDCSMLDDILVWKRKHLDQLQTQVSENNITDELKDIQTLPAVPPVDSSPPAPLRNSDKVENASEKTGESLPSLELSAESFERLRVELRRQELRVKLYESMLRKHRRDLQALQSAYEDQKVSYEEEITTLKQELFQLREFHKADVPPTDSSELELSGKEVQTEADARRPRPHSRHTLEVTRPADDSLNGERQRSSDNIESSGVEVASDAQLARLERRIAAEEEALNFLRDDLSSKDQHLKTLRMTLRELSNCNSELLEKNIELETLLNQKLSHTPRSAKTDARENCLLEEIDRCISDLSRLADALLAMSDGLDPLPLLLLNGQDKGAALRCAVVPNSAGSMESRIGKITEVQATINRIREHIIQRVLISRYK